MHAALPVLLLLGLGLAGCTAPPGPGPDGPGPRVFGDGRCPPIPRGHVAVEVTETTVRLEQVVLVRAARYVPQLSCRAPGSLETVTMHRNTTGSGIVDAGTFAELRLVFEDRVIRAAAELRVPETGGLLRVALRGERVDLTWDSAALPIERMEVQPDPFALERQGGSVTFGLDNGTRRFPVVANSSWNLGLFVGYRAQALQEWDEQDGYRGPVGSLAVRLLDPAGAPRRQDVVALPYGHESFGYGPLSAGHWTLVVDTVSEGGPGLAEAEVYWHFDV